MIVGRSWLFAEWERLKLHEEYYYGWMGEILHRRERGISSWCGRVQDFLRSAEATGALDLLYLDYTGQLETLEVHRRRPAFASPGTAPAFSVSVALDTMASADAMPVLMEHDITVVNTFVQVSEARPRQFLQRSQTAPEAALVMEEPTASEGDLHITGKAAEQKTDKEVIEESPESTEPVKTVKKLQTLRTLNRFETPDPWDLEALCKSLDEAPEEALPAKAGVSKPCLLHSATPDRWEWDAMVREEKIMAPALEAVAPPATQATQAVPGTASAWVPTQPCLAQAAPMVSLLPVPVTLAMPVAPMPALQPGCDYPRLLGSVSPASQGSPKPTSPSVSPSVSPRVRPGTLEATQLDENRQLVKWYVDAAKFESNSERLLSPEFQLHFPGQAEPSTFRMVILARQTGGKHGAGFKKAKGWGSIELKCSSAVPSGVGSIAACVTVGEGARKQLSAQPIEHNFGDKTCCQLRNGEEADWDFRQSISRDAKNCEISVEIHF
ncbi:unnamed protein product [Symbiodinium natans]|uniref:Uncharacterized protein n=1 Tax=Symbiodinium natans TaxID=878477 RepID=A0A812MK35_9DINO|nr:unnamed protein product [Symbiodinium natans]